MPSGGASAMARAYHETEGPPVMSVSESPQPKRRRRADAERNRLRLLEIARAAFASGEATVSLERIARDADVGIGTLYRHFPTREALVEALYRQELDELCASPAELLRTLTPELALRAWMDRFRGYVIAKREMAETLRAVFASGAFTVTGIREELSAAVRQILDCRCRRSQPARRRPCRGRRRLGRRDVHGDVAGRRPRAARPDARPVGGRGARLVSRVVGSLTQRGVAGGGCQGRRIRGVAVATRGFEDTGRRRQRCLDCQRMSDAGH